MAAIDFPTATSNGQTFEADSGVIYTYVGTPPNGFWSGTFGTTGLTTLDGRYIAKNDGNTLQTIQTQGLKFNSGSSDTILLDGLNGKVGIGTTSPATALHVSGSGTQRIRITGTGVANAILTLDAPSSYVNYIEYGASASTPLAFYDVANTAERMRIDSSGRLLVGDSSVFANANADDLQIGATTTANVGLTIGSSTQGQIAFGDAGEVRAGLIHYQHTDNSMRFFTSGPSNERMRIDSSGNVGVGTTSPNNKLVVSTSNQGLEVSPGSTNTLLSYDRTASAYLPIRTRASSHTFSSGSTDFVTIDSSGNLNFRQASASSPYPQQKLKWSNDITKSDGFYISQDTNRNGRIWHEQGLDILFGTLNTERMRIDFAGRVGIKNNSMASLYSGGDDLVVGSGGSTDQGITIYTGTSNQGILAFADGSGSAATEYAGYVLYSHNGDYMSFATTGQERMRIDSSGRLLVGTTSASSGRSAVFQGHSGATSGQAIVSFGCDSTAPGSGGVLGSLRFCDGNKNDGAIIDVIRDGGTWTSGSSQPSAILFKTAGNGSASPAEHARLQSNGTFKTSTSTSLSTRYSGNTYHLSHNHNNGNVAHIFEHSGAVTPYGIYVQFSQKSPDNNVQYFISAEDSIANRFYVWSDGDVVNHDNSYGAISDIKLKQDIIDSGSQWNDLKNLRVRKFKFKSDVEAYGDEAKTLIGLIAQEAELVSPGLVRESPDTDGDNNDLGTTTKSINYSVLYMKAVKGLQEAMDRIETLEAIDHDQFQNTSALLNQPLITFLNSSGATAGEIIHSGVNSVTYATSSDHRLKENVTDLTAAIPRLKNLAPKRFNFIGADQVTVDGFLAHEAQTVVPEAVTGTHNEVDGDGNAVMQGIDQSKLVPLLTAALQEAITKIETLETKVAALEAAG